MENVAQTTIIRDENGDAANRILVVETSHQEQVRQQKNEKKKNVYSEEFL